MLYYERTFEVPEFGVRLNQRALMTPEIRFYDLESRGVVVEHGLTNLATTAVAGRAQVNLMREGVLTLRRDEGVFRVGAGEAFREPTLRYDERWEGEPFRVLCVDWTTDELTPIETRVLSDRATEVLAGIELTEDVGGHEEVALRVVALLEEEGLGSPPIDTITARVAPELQRIAREYGRAMSSLSEQPMWCDFTEAVGMSERQLRRHMTEVLSWFPGPVDEVSFRSVLNSTRMRRGLALMTASGATVGKVSEVLGYGSAVAFTNACQRAGLGKPSDFAERVAALGG